MKNNQYCWEISVFFGKNQTPIQTIETFGPRSDILCYVQWFDECDRYEATPKPLECFTHKNFTYDTQHYEAMKISGKIRKERSLAKSDL